MASFRSGVVHVLSVCFLYGTRVSGQGVSSGLETVVQEQANAIQLLTTKLTAQGEALTSLTERVSQLEGERQNLQDRLTKQEQRVAFFVDFGLSPLEEINIGQDNPVLFERTLLNMGDAYNNVTGKFTVPVSGLYSFTLHIIGGVGDHDDIEVGIFTDQGMMAVAAAEGSNKDSNDKDSCTALLHLQQGDEVYVKHSYGGVYLWGSQETSFFGFLLSAD